MELKNIILSEVNLFQKARGHQRPVPLLRRQRSGGSQIEASLDK
jgi:hypothetical protein